MKFDDVRIKVCPMCGAGNPRDRKKCRICGAIFYEGE